MKMKMKMNNPHFNIIVDQKRASVMNAAFNSLMILMKEESGIVQEFKERDIGPDEINDLIDEFNGKLHRNNMCDDDCDCDDGEWEGGIKIIR